MKIIITHQSNSISFEIEENLPEHEAFGVLRAFTVSAFENLPDPLVYSLSGAVEPFLMQDPKDWKEGAQKHFRGSVICLTVVDPSAEADSDESDSYVHITDSGDVKATEKATEAVVAKPAEPAKDEKAEEAVVAKPAEPAKDEKAEEAMVAKLVEPAYDSEAELEDKQTDEEEEEEVNNAGEGDAEPQAAQDMNPQALCKRVKQFIVEIGSEGIQNIAMVVYTLVTEGNITLSDAIRTAVETSEKAANHPLTQDLLAVADVYVQKFQNQFNWHAMLSQFNIEQIVALIPGIVDALTRSMEGAQDVELDLSPLMLQMCPMLARMQQFIPRGEERVFRCNPFNPTSVFQEARQQMEEEFPQANEDVVHRGITCDGCDMCPIVGVRYKSVLRADFDLCENCEKDHDPKDPLIKIKTPVEDMELLPGLSEFRRSVGGGRGRHCPRRRGRGRGWCRPRRGCGRRPCGSGGMPQKLAQMFQNHPVARAMREQFCQPQAASADHRDPARAESDVVADKEEEMKVKKEEVREAKAKVKALKKEMKACRKEMKKAKKQAKDLKKLDGEVIGHLDTEEKSVQKAGAMALKTWKVKNIGTETWSEDTIAIFHSGNQSLVVPGYEVIQVGSLEPNDVAYIRCMLSVPEVAGTYSLTYRLSGPTGKFGGRLMTEIEVADSVKRAPEKKDEPKVTFTSEPGNNIPKAIDLADDAEEEMPEVAVQPKPSAPSQPEKKKFQFQKQKDQLKLMGFEMDDETLESVLVACKGDIGQAISLLM